MQFQNEPTTGVEAVERAMQTYRRKRSYYERKVMPNEAVARRHSEPSDNAQPVEEAPPSMKSSTGVNPVIVILHIVAARYNVEPFMLSGSLRFKKYVKPRHIAIWIARRLTKQSYPQIARVFGGRDHTSMINAVWRVDERRAFEEGIATETDNLLEMCRGQLP